MMSLMSERVKRGPMEWGRCTQDARDRQSWTPNPNPRNTAFRFRVPRARSVDGGAHGG